MQGFKKWSLPHMLLCLLFLSLDFFMPVRLIYLITQIPHNIPSVSICHRVLNHFSIDAIEVFPSILPLLIMLQWTFMCVWIFQNSAVVSKVESPRWNDTYIENTVFQKFSPLKWNINLLSHQKFVKASPSPYSCQHSYYQSFYCMLIF